MGRTQVRKATVNYAASGCARASFQVKGVSNALTRSFVIPNAKLPTEFGITETVGTMGEQAKARAWVTALRERIAAVRRQAAGRRGHPHRPPGRPP